MPLTTRSNFGDLVLVRFPFTDQSGAKQRPAVVISNSAYQRQRPDVILLAITSQLRLTLGFGEALITDWQRAGLLKASVLKPIIFTAEKNLLHTRLGSLSERDQRTLRQLLQTLIG
jgi:mRNA interferase MazF